MHNAEWFAIVWIIGTALLCIQTLVMLWTENKGIMILIAAGLFFAIVITFIASVFLWYFG